jgi:hypothetical protein
MAGELGHHRLIQSERLTGSRHDDQLHAVPRGLRSQAGHDSSDDVEGTRSREDDGESGSGLGGLRPG